MMMLCIKREDFFKSEFRELTASNQVAAIALLVTVHIYSFAMLIHLLINSNVEFVLSDSNGAISKLPDIIYYVIITYTSVGYGDITPQGAAARIVATMISVTGYFMSAVVIGIIIGTAISKKSETDK
jgi:voltage-gated potassium channel